MWRVLRPSRENACHEIDSWAGDFATHPEALEWATNPKAREDWLARHEHRFQPTGAHRIAWIEGLTAECRTQQSAAVFGHLFSRLLNPNRGGDAQ